MMEVDDNGGGSSVSEFKPKKWPQFIAGAFGSMGGMIVGIVITWPFFALRNLRESGDLGEISVEEAVVIDVIAFIAAIFGVIPTGWAVDRFGRRKTLMVLCVPTLIGWLFIIFARNLGMVFIGRLITGLFMGAFSIACPIYIVEIAGGTLKGNLGCQFQNQIVQGFLFVYINGHSHNWRWLSVFCGTMSMPILIGMYFMPETPTFLLAHGRLEEARKSLKWLRGARSFEQISPELEEVRKSMGEVGLVKVQLGGLFAKETWRPLTLSLGLLTVYQFGQALTLLVPVEQVFKNVGVEWSNTVCMIAFGASGGIGVFLASLIADRTGRKVLLWVSVAAFTISVIPLGILKPWDSSGQVSSTVSITTLVTLLASNFTFNLGLGPIPWILLVELSPPERRGKVGSIPVTLSWLTALTISLFVHLFITTSISAIYFWISMGLLMCGAAGILYYLPETRNRNFDDIVDRF